MVFLDVISPKQIVLMILENFRLFSTSKSASKHSMLNGSPPIIAAPNLYTQAWMALAGRASASSQLNCTVGN